MPKFTSVALLSSQPIFYLSNMRISTLNTTPRIESTNNKTLGIQSYGEQNDYPQRVREIVEASVTGKSCYNTYRKFIYGRGFRNEEFAKAVINSKGDTADSLLLSESDDLAMNGGVAIHVNYDANFNIVTACHIPFEWARLALMDENYKVDKLALHPDWGKRHTSLHRFEKDDIEFFDFYNPDPEVIAKQVEEAGGWNGYKGQILYFSFAGDKVYPLPLFSAALTDMSNEEGLSNITHRNVRHNFLPAGMLIDRNNAETPTEEEEAKREVAEFQGDMNAGKLMYVILKNGEEAPEFKPFQTASTDGEFEKAEAKTPDIIGSAFNQPPILRAKDVGASFGADLMRNAYDFYNAQTETERLVLESIFKEIFSHWSEDHINLDGDYSILAKVYKVNQTLAERLGANTEKVLEILSDATKSESAKRVILEVIYGLDDEDVNKLMEGLKNVD